MFPYLMTGRLGHTRVKSAHVFHQKYSLFYKTFFTKCQLQSIPSRLYNYTNQAIQFSFGSPNNVKGIPTLRSLAPDVDVTGRTGEIQSGLGTTVAFYSPSDLFQHTTLLDHWKASSQSISHTAHSTPECSVGCCVASGWPRVDTVTISPSTHTSGQQSCNLVH